MDATEPLVMNSYVKVDEHGQVTTIVGPYNVNIFRNRMIFTGLKLEVANPGMRLTRKAPKCSTLVKQELGLKGNPKTLLAKLFAYVVEHPEWLQYENPIHLEAVRKVVQGV